MTPIGWAQILAFCLALLVTARPVGLYLRRVYDGSFRWLGWLERPIYRIAGIDPDADMRWTAYARALLGFSAVSMLLTYLVFRAQHLLPLNPQGLPGLPARQAFETAASFTTNTNWQSYAGEGTMSYLSQMTQLAFHNFVSAAAGIAVAVALVRGLARQSAGRIGNFWADLVRGTLYLLLPLSLLLALLFVQQGVIQSFAPSRELTTLEGVRQLVALGPVASQEAIKQLGTNGGGFFNANAAHPFENPTPWSSFLSAFAILLIPSGLVWWFGDAVRHRAHGWSVWAAMMILLLGGITVAYWAEARGNPVHAAHGLDLAASSLQPGGNMEGKEVRFGVPASALYATVTTAASCGAVNAMHDAFTPVGGLVPLLNMQLGEVVFGGVGAGLYGILMMAVLSVFIAGLMVGRTPEYLGNRIRTREVQMVMIYALVFAAGVLLLTAVSVITPAGLAGRNNAGPHGFSEILYAFSSVTANNGSAFAGLTGTTTWYNTLLGLGTLIGRFGMMVPVLALAGFFAEQPKAQASAGTFPVHGPLFATLLIGVILVVGALTFFPALALGPVVEHFLMQAGRVF